MFELYIETANAAFEQCPKATLATMLRKLADQLDSDNGDSDGLLYDPNGNQCGLWALEVQS